MGIILLVGYMFYDSLKMSLFLAPYILIHCKVRYKSYCLEKKDRLAQSFKDGIQVLKSLLQTGYSFENAVRGSLSEVEMIYGKKDPTYQGLLKVSNLLSLNVSIEEAFDGFATESGVEEIQYFSEVLKIAKKSGGNLIGIIGNTIEIISDRIDVKREIRTITAAKKLEQRIMNMVPLGIILYMRFSSIGMMNKLYGNPAGIIIMTLCLIVYGVAILLAGKITDIRV
jgi:tight adherence protein B